MLCLFSPQAMFRQIRTHIWKCRKKKKNGTRRPGRTIYSVFRKAASIPGPVPLAVLSKISLHSVSPQTILLTLSPHLPSTGQDGSLTAHPFMELQPPRDWPPQALIQEENSNWADANVSIART
ncbi:hypothetical protein AX14_002366 [Amanita brunnescens Koide BX004]|nr:hypothetical protein AX14_002366 [Amanita brunnescens Koide BX004]